MSVDKCKCPPPNTRNYYRYYDTPDGCDVAKKVGVTTRYGLLVGVIAGTYDVMMYSHAVGLSNVLRRYAMHAVPLGLMGATFAVVANSVQNMRKKDDALNYFLGGFACGPILATYVGSKHAVLIGGILLGIAGVIKKDAVDKCITLFPTDEHRSHRGSVNLWRHDYSLVADPRDEMLHTCGKK